MKLNKKSLRKDTVKSNTIHFGIELELRALCDETGEHDSESCDNNQREYLESEGALGILRHYVGLSRDEAQSLESYFNVDSWIDDYMNDWSCDDSECPYTHKKNGDTVRDTIKDELTELTGNNSVKVVEDGSIKTKNGQNTDAEVCWNYYASKETLKDNAIILNYLKNAGCDFDTTCGLHINVNNYLNLETNTDIPTKALDFLFNFVAPSRRSKHYCNANAISNSEKYSMLYNQGDRVEFRFFSPTLDAEKLNHYVRLVHTVYKRLAGIDAKLPKKSMRYFLDKMVNVNGVSRKDAFSSLCQVNTLMPYKKLVEKNKKVLTE